MINSAPRARQIGLGRFKCFVLVLSNDPNIEAILISMLLTKPVVITWNSCVHQDKVCLYKLQSSSNTKFGIRFIYHMTFLWLPDQVCPSISEYLNPEFMLNPNPCSSEFVSFLTFVTQRSISFLHLCKISFHIHQECNLLYCSSYICRCCYCC